MGKFDGVLIVSDVDGTFLGKGSRVVPENIEKLKYFISEGGLFTLATGRIYNTIEFLIPCVYDILSAPAILANGTYFYDFKSNERSDEEFVDAAALRELLHYVKDNYPDMEFRVSARAGQLTDSVEGPFLSAEHARSNDGLFFVYPDIDGIPGDDWYKCVFRAAPEELLRLRADIEPKYSDLFTFTLSGSEIFELQKRGTSKAAKMLELKQKYADEGRPVTVYACGDYENDYEMLLAADVAVCPTNALDKIKAICDISPCDNDEGLIAALIEIIEENLENGKI